MDSGYDHVNNDWYIIQGFSVTDHAMFTAMWPEKSSYIEEHKLDKSTIHP